jgi:3-oxoacyl-[acyl-carrier protein] reductase
LKKKDMLLSGKTALITGAARGIGRAIAVLYAHEGADIAFTDLRIDENMESLENEIAALGRKAKGYASDASDFAGAEALVDQVASDFGKIDILVNNAGITRDSLLMRMSESDWDLVIKVNLKSVFNMTKAVQKYMLKQRFGSIINMSSVVGVNGNAGQSNYSASKAGLIGFTKSVAQELGSRNVRCNAIAPGFIETEMTAKLPGDVRDAWIADIPLKRGGKPEDVANVALFLASDLSDYVTAQVISVCGGMNPH